MKELRRITLTALILAALALATPFLLNQGGWRSRILARALRTDNYPRVVAPPSGFHPKVPDGFEVSVFASGFVEPRWLAVAPNGDVFVADSAAGQVIVLHDRARKGSADSREVFADHLLADEVRKVEEQFRRGRVANLSESLIKPIRERYELTT